MLVRVSAVSLNPVDWKMRSGEAKERFPVEFPGVIGRDVAGVVREVGAGVKGFEAGDRVMALADHTYAELCVVKASDLAKVPEGLEMTTAGAIPLVALTGDQLIHKAAKVQSGQTVVITGALGSVGRVCGVRGEGAGGEGDCGRSKEAGGGGEEAAGGSWTRVAVDDEAGLAKLGVVDSVADTVGGGACAEADGEDQAGWGLLEVCSGAAEGRGAAFPRWK